MSVPHRRPDDGAAGPRLGGPVSGPASGPVSGPVSGDLAIATVTEALRQLLQAAVDADLPGTTVAVARPGDQQSRLPGTRIELHLYRVTTNADMRNEPPVARPGGIADPPAGRWLDLHYLVAASGDDALLEPHRLIGIVVRTLDRWPMLESPVTGDPAQRVPLRHVDLSLEDLAHLWSGLLRAPAMLSVACTAGPVLVGE
jgi:Pvc16 N-terminal domain